MAVKTEPLSLPCLFLIFPKSVGAIKGVPRGGVQCGSAPHWPLHPGGLLRQTPVYEPAYWWHPYLQGVHCAGLQRGGIYGCVFTHEVCIVDFTSMWRTFQLLPFFHPLSVHTFSVLLAMVATCLQLSMEISSTSTLSHLLRTFSTLRATMERWVRQEFIGCGRSGSYKLHKSVFEEREFSHLSNNFAAVTTSL